MNQIYHIYRKEDLMKRIVLLLAVGLMSWTGDSFGEAPGEFYSREHRDHVHHQFRHPDLMAEIEKEFRILEKTRFLEQIQSANWGNAEKIGMYEVELPSDILALHEHDHPSQVELGKEYWMPCYRARVENIINSDTCELRFESGDVFYLTGCSTEGFYSGKFIVLTSPVLCSRIHSDGTRILRFVPKEELAPRVEDGDVFDKNQIAALQERGYERWQYQNGEVFWAKFQSFSRGKIHFLDWEGNELTVKPGQLSSASNRLYRQKVREGKL